MNRIPSFRQLRWLLRDQAGVALIEFAFMAPILILLVYGIVEVTRYVQMHQKLDNAGHTLVDVLTQNLNLSLADISDVVATTPSLVAPFDAEGVSVIITSIAVPEHETTPTTLWQVTDGTGQSRISSGKGYEPSLPQLQLVERDQVLTVEIFLQYRPMMDSTLIRNVLGLDEEGVYKLNIARPRYGAFEFEPK